MIFKKNTKTLAFFLFLAKLCQSEKWVCWMAVVFALITTVFTYWVSPKKKKGKIGSVIWPTHFMTMIAYNRKGQTPIIVVTQGLILVKRERVKKGNNGTPEIWNASCTSLYAHWAMCEKGTSPHTSLWPIFELFFKKNHRHLVEKAYILINPCWLYVVFLSAHCINHIKNAHLYQSAKLKKG